MKAREHAERLFFPLVGKHPHQDLLPTRASARNATRWSSMEHEPYYGVSAGFRMHSLRTADATDARLHRECEHGKRRLEVGAFHIQHRRRLDQSESRAGRRQTCRPRVAPLSFAGKAEVTFGTGLGQIAVRSGTKSSSYLQTKVWYINEISVLYRMVK